MNDTKDNSPEDMETKIAELKKLFDEKRLLEEYQKGTNEAKRGHR